MFGQSYGIFKFLTFVEKKSDDEISKEIDCHLLQLKTELMHFFSDVTSCTFSLNLFFIDLADVPVGTEKQEELIDIQTDETAKVNHRECFLMNFCLGMVLLSLNLVGHAVSQLLIFPSMWEYERGFQL